MNKSNIALIIIVTVAVIKDFYILPTYINILMHLISCLVAVGSDYFVYCYYGSFTDARKSLLSYTIMLLSFVSGLTALWYNISAIILEFPDLLQPWFHTYPNATCSVLRAETLSQMMLAAFTLTQLLKALIVYDSFLFYKINHEKVFKIIIIVITIIFFGGNILRGIYKGTFCTATRFLRYEKFNGIKVPISEVKPGFPIYLLYVLFLLIASILLGVLKSRKRKRLDIFSTIVKKQAKFSIFKPKSDVKPKQILSPSQLNVTFHNENVRNKKQLAASNNIFTISHTNESLYKFEDILTKIEESDQALGSHVQREMSSSNSSKAFSMLTTNAKYQNIPLAKAININEYNKETDIIPEVDISKDEQTARENKSMIINDPLEIIQKQEHSQNCFRFKSATNYQHIKGNYFYLKLFCISKH